jgi:hypothetical protein
VTVPARASWRETAVVVLVLGLPLLAMQLGRPVPRLDADAVEYYAHVRSLYFDGDLDFANEFHHFGILARYDKIVPTATGHRRTVFSIGPAILWMPFYAAGDVVARLAGDRQDGYSPAHIRAVLLGSLAYGLAGLGLLHRLLRRSWSAAVSFWTLVLVLYATFLFWYLAVEAAMSHATAFFLAVAALTVWWDGRDGLTPVRAGVLGLVVGLLAAVRWQGALVLVLPGLTLLLSARRTPGPALRAGAAVAAGFLLGALPQLLAWKAIFGSYLLADPPQGRRFLRLDRPFLLETLFSSRHGLLFWTPVLWAAFLGYVPLVRRERRLGLTLLALVCAMTYVNACSGDWWAGGSFSNRRFDTALPLLALGLAASLKAVHVAAVRYPGRVLAAAGLLLTAWNLVFMQQYRLNMIPRDDTVSFATVAENNAILVSDAVGAPVAWPANWIFALRHGLPPARHDRMVGKYLFYYMNNLAGRIDLGDPDIDSSLLGEGWGPRRDCFAAVCRELTGRARVFAPLDVPEAFDVTVRAEGEGEMEVAVNGAPVARLPLTSPLQELTFRVPAAVWRKDLNEIVLTVSPGGRALVDRLVFARVRT